MSALKPSEVSDDRSQRTWQALGEVADHPVVAAWRDQARKTRAPRRMPWAVAAGVAVVSVGALSYWASHQKGVGVPLAGKVEKTVVVADGVLESFATARGERRKALLADGSSITLNTSSRATVDYRGNSRSVRLLEGEALFEVAKDSRRPFVVTAAGRQVVALGTAFGVRLEGTAVQVTLVDGRVAVDKVELAPGQQWHAESAGQPVIRAVDVARATSWKNGWLVLNRDTVSDAVREVSRYTEERIICDDPRLAGLHVSGTFRTGEVESFLNALSEIHPLSVERSRPGELRLVWRE